MRVDNLGPQLVALKQLQKAGNGCGCVPTALIYTQQGNHWICGQTLFVHLRSKVLIVWGFDILSVSLMNNVETEDRFP